MTLTLTTDQQFKDELVCAFNRNDEPMMKRICQRHFGPRVLDATVENQRFIVSNAGCEAMPAKEPICIPVMLKEPLLMQYLFRERSAIELELIGIQVSYIG